MARICLIRHAQASFASEDYDALSPLGHQQAKRLGEYFASLYQPELIISGAMLRHQQTADGFRHAVNKQTSFETQSGFDEFDHMDVLRVYNPRWQTHGDIVNDMAEQENPSHFFQQQFQNAVEHWYSGDHDKEYRESWPGFQQRVNRAFAQLQQQALSEEIRQLIVVSSGGSISVVLGEMLGLSARKIFALNAVMVNAGISEVLFRSEELGINSSLSVFNNFSYLQQHNPDWVTYR